MAQRMLDLVPRSGGYEHARPTPLEQIHLTLLFIGDTADRLLPHVVESVERSVAGLSPCVLRVASPMVLPPKGMARVLALELSPHRTILEIHRRLANRLTSTHRMPDRFLPHITIARFPGPGVDRATLAPWSLPEIDEYPIEFLVDRVILIRSVLGGGPEGRADHKPVASIVLGA